MLFANKETGNLTEEQELLSIKSSKEVGAFGIAATTFTPLFQTNFLPDLTHVNVLPDATEVIPALLHLAPALAAAFAGTRGRDREAISTDKKIANLFFMI